MSSTSESRNYQEQQRCAIKTRLNYYFEKSMLSCYAIKAIYDKQYSPNSINYGTLHNTLDMKKSTLDLHIVLFLQQLWHIPLSHLFASPDAATEAPTIDSELQSGGFQRLDDEHYKGRFHGYMYSPNPAKKAIVHFTIDFGNTPLAQTHAMLTYDGSTMGADGLLHADQRVCYGEPIDIKKKSIFIRFTNEDADFFFMYFSHTQFRASSLYYRRGIALTYSNLNDNSPISQNFILFHHELSEDNQRYIPGLLAMTDERNIMVPCAAIESFKNESEQSYVERFAKDFGYMLEHNKSEYYRINEREILSTFAQDEDCSDVLKALLLLKARSSAPRQLIYEDNAYYSNFLLNAQRENANIVLP